MDITSFILSRRDAALLVGDYKSYHAQLSRNLASARKKLGRATHKNAKFTGHKEVTAEDVGGNVAFAHLLLLTAERAYAHAMSLKASGGEDTNALPGSTRREIVSRLNKAAKTASKLVALLEDKSTTKATESDFLEARAYASSLYGAEEFEKHAHTARTSDKEFQRGVWSSCLEQYSTARVIYASLLKSTKQELYKDLLATTVDPAIRFAAYQSHIPRTLAVVTVSRKCFPQDDARLVKSIKALDSSAFEDERSASGGDTGAANIPTTITWRGREAQIPDASIGQALAATDAASEALVARLMDKPEASAKDKAAAYDEVLIAAQDAADATRHAIDQHEKEGIPESDARMQDLRVTFLAVTYEMISWRVGRNRVLIGGDDGASIDGPPLKKRKRMGKDGKEVAGKESKEGNGRILARLRERVVLFDAILQSIDSVLEVPGAVRDEGFVAEMGGKRDYFRALKCLNIAYSHSLLSSHRNALALLLRSSQFSTNALKVLSASSGSTSNSAPRLDISPSTLESFHQRIKQQTLHLRGLVELQKHNENAAATATKNAAGAAPVVESLDEYPAFALTAADLKGDGKGLNLVSWPPQLKPVPVKPLFLDVAWNYIEYPGRGGADVRGPEKAGVTQEKAEVKAEEKKKGWFGFGR